MPLPFSRVLQLTSPALMNGDDVFILQNLLLRVPSSNVTASGMYDEATAAAVLLFKTLHGVVPLDDIFDAPGAAAALSILSADGYVDDGVAPAQLGYLYKVLIPVHLNRSIEANAKLIAANGSVVYSFTARLHGIDAPPPPPWPYYSSTVGLNM